MVPGDSALRDAVQSILTTAPCLSADSEPLYWIMVEALKTVNTVFMRQITTYSGVEQVGGGSTDTNSSRLRPDDHRSWSRELLRAAAEEPHLVYRCVVRVLDTAGKAVPRQFFFHVFMLAGGCKQPSTLHDSSISDPRFPT